MTERLSERKPPEKKFDLLVAGELNVDLIMDGLSGIPQPEQEKTATSATLALGSSSAIFAANISRLGLRTAFCGLLGRDSWGEFILESLQSAGIDARYIRSDPDLQTGVTVALNLGGERMMVTHPGAMVRFTPDDIPADHFEMFRHLHVSSLFLQPGLKNKLPDLFARAKGAGLTTSLDPQWDPEEEWDLDLAKLLPVLDFFLPNERELLNLTRSVSLVEAVGRLPSTGCRIVVKRGDQGAMMVRTDEPGLQIEAPAFLLPEFRDAIGAGDSFNAGFIHAFLKGWDPVECLKFGNLTGAVSTTATGGTRGIRSFRQVVDIGNTLGIVFPGS